MTRVGSVYGQALFDLAKDEGLLTVVLEDLKVLLESFGAEPTYLKLLAANNLSVEERCGILDASLRGKVHLYVLNFLKILTEKGYVREFADCYKSYEALYFQEEGILPVKATTAVPLTQEQAERLLEKLTAISGKKIQLEQAVDPDCIGGMRLDYDGKRLDDTVLNRLESVRTLLKKTVL
jgi:F-type H+-transporting ATPase subunit delta